MIFDGIHDDVGHMMNWPNPAGALIILGVISLTIIIIILIFVLNRYTNHEEYLEDTTDTIAPSESQKELKTSEKTEYCPACGSKLGDRNSKFCTLCGTKL